MVSNELRRQPALYLIDRPSAHAAAFEKPNARSNRPETAFQTLPDDPVVGPTAVVSLVSVVLPKCCLIQY